VEPRLAWLLAALSIASLGALLALRIQRWLRTTRLRRRMARARSGEVAARTLLVARGFTVEREQAPGAMVLRVDGAPASFPLRADYLVRRRGRRYVAEVKTGERAPDLSHAPTRRQLLEYALAFDVDGVLLLDPEGHRVREIGFPPSRPRSRWTGLLAFLAGAVLGGWIDSLR
jgi:hypothetical protein